MKIDEDLNIEYTDINEANRQIKILTNEKNKILEHIMSRTCENCKYSKGVRSSRYNSRIDARHCTVLNQKVEDNFGCVKFERKEL